ncbi:MAG: DUF5677 domain-containing protein, partial [Candidatus Acidiferrales bacterium]
VKDVKFPIKQAFAHVTVMQKGAFTSHDAMRVFRRLSLRIGPDSATFGERQYTVIKSLNEFDKKEIHGVMSSLVAQTDRDRCFKGIYLRAKANVESLLSLRYAKDFQAIAMITRSLFELAVDIKLITQIRDAVVKIAAFSEVERLRAAKMIVAFKVAHPAATVDSTVHALFIKNNATRIETERKSLWGANARLKHWSGLSLKERVLLLKDPFEEVYEVKYPQLSWYTHAAGLTGFDLKASSYEKLATTHHYLAVQMYKALLRTIIEEYQFLKWDSNIHNKMKQAELMPFMDTEEGLEALERELLG